MIVMMSMAMTGKTSVVLLCVERRVLFNAQSRPEADSVESAVTPTRRVQVARIVAEVDVALKAIPKLGLGLVGGQTTSYGKRTTTMMRCSW